jgi:hypothetical protein
MVAVVKLTCLESNRLQKRLHLPLWTFLPCMTVSLRQFR